MATTYTDTIALAKMATDDPFDVSLLNGNADTVDAAIKKAYQGKAAHNLLDNSDFTNPINQRGETAYTSADYTIDRWKAQNGTQVTINGGYVTISGEWSALQPFSRALPAGKYCAVVCYRNTEETTYGMVTGLGSMSAGEVQEIPWDTISTDWAIRVQNLTLSEDLSDPYFIVGPRGGSMDVKWAALYEGHYGDAWYPEYIPKGYAAELAECRRYYLPLNQQLLGAGYTFASGAALLIPCKMRIDAPTFAASGTIKARVNGSDYTLDVKSVATDGGMIKVDFSGDVPANYPCAFYVEGATANLSADL